MIGVIMYDRDPQIQHVCLRTQANSSDVVNSLSLRVCTYIILMNMVASGYEVRISIGNGLLYLVYVYVRFGLLSQQDDQESQGKLLLSNVKKALLASYSSECIRLLNASSGTI